MRTNTRKFRLVLTWLTLAALVLSVFGAVLVRADTLNVDRNNLACNDTTGSPYCTIQAAIDGASDGDTINVAAGTYNESLLIDGVDVSLIAVGDVSIVAPTPNQFATTIQIYNSTCAIDGFTVVGGYLGIYALGEVNVTIRNNTVEEYLKNGITVNGELATAQISKNTVTGGGMLGYPHYAQNGIQVGKGASGTVHRNTVNGNWYTGDDWTACGILIFESDDVSVQRNSVSASETGIDVETWGYIRASASENKIIANTVSGAKEGIRVLTYVLSHTNSAPIANNNKVVNNVVVAGTGDDTTGIFVGTAGGDTFTGTVDNNKVIRNQISGYTTAIDETGTATKMHANVVE